MSRTITVAADTELASQHVPAMMLVELDFPSGFLRLNNSGQTFEWDSKTWYAGGSLLGISEIAESASLEAHGVTLELNAVSLAPITGSPNEVNIVQLARAQNYQGRTAKIWLAPLDETTYQPITDPVLAFEGRMNKMDYQVGDDATFALAVESRHADWNRPRTRRYNDADQKSRFPSDRGLEFIEQMVEKQLFWGVGGGVAIGPARTTDFAGRPLPAPAPGFLSGTTPQTSRFGGGALPTSQQR